MQVGNGADRVVERKALIPMSHTPPACRRLIPAASPAPAGRLEKLRSAASSKAAHRGWVGGVGAALLALATLAAPAVAGRPAGNAGAVRAASLRHGLTAGLLAQAATPRPSPSDLPDGREELRDPLVSPTGLYADRGPATGPAAAAASRRDSGDDGLLVAGYAAAGVVVVGGLGWLVWHAVRRRRWRKALSAAAATAAARRRAGPVSPSRSRPA
jgi:hypothetical protein